MWHKLIYLLCSRRRLAPCWVYYIFLLVAFVSSLATTAQAGVSLSTSQRLYVATRAGRYGFVNERGEVVIPAHYESARDFHDGLAAVKLNGKWGFISRSGQLIIEPRFAEVADFVNGRAAVAIFDSTLFRPRQSDKHARIQYFERRFLFIDTKGEFLSLRSVQITDCASTELPVVMDEHPDSSYSYYDPQTLRHARYNLQDRYLNCFQEGYAPFTVNGKHGYLATDGHAAIAPRFQAARPFNGGVASVVEHGKYGFIDRTGNYIISPKFDWATPMIDGVAVFRSGNRYGIIHQDGSITEPVGFSRSSPLSSDLFAAWDTSAGAYDLIDETGTPVTSTTFTDVAPFKGPLAAATTSNGESVYLDRKGNIVWRNSR